MEKSKSITQAALIAGLYIVLTVLSSMMGLSSGVIQVRFSEALTILPVFTPAAIPGLTVGCVVANLMSGAHIYDVIFGSFATLIGAVFSRVLRKNKYLAVFPPIISNTIIIPLVLSYVYHFPGALWYFGLTVFAGEFISCGVFGISLHKVLEKRNLF